MKILFPTDFSESAQNAFQYALIFADKTDSEIDLLHVIYPVADAVDSPSLAGEVIKVQIETAKELMKEFIDNGLMKINSRMKKLLNIESKIEIGVPVSMIKKEAEKGNVDLVIMGTKSIHNAYEKVIGTVSEGVLTKVDCPVLIVPETAKIKSIQCIAYATDVNEGDPFEIWKTSNLLAPLNAIVRVVHIHAEKEAASKLEGFEKLKSYFKDHPAGLQMQFQNLSGKDIERALNDFMYLYDVDLLVMYRPKRSLMSRLFHKSHTQKMTSETEVPLLVMKN